MQKYKTEFKLKVVKSFLAGDGGAKLMSRRWSVPEEKIRTWGQVMIVCTALTGYAPSAARTVSSSSCRRCLTRTVNSFRAARLRRCMTSEIPIS